MGDGKVRPLRFTRGRISAEITIFTFIVVQLWRASTWALRRLKPAFYHPVALAGTFTYTLAYLASPWAACALLWGVAGWAAIKPDSYLRHAQWRIESFRAGFKYRYRPRRRLTANGLLTAEDPLPTISAVHKAGCTTKVRIKMSYGDDIDYWRERATRIAQTYNALDVKINPYRRQVLAPWKHTLVTKPRWLECEFLTKDPFTANLGTEFIDYHRNNNTLEPVVAVHRSGQPQEDNLAAHLLRVAMTRWGKSNAIRARIYANRDRLKDGTLELWGIDGKGGVEQAFLQHVFARVAYGDTELNPNAYNPQQFDRLLKDAVKVLKRRQKRMRGNTTEHTPTKQEPWLLIVIDELLVLTSKNIQPELRNSIAASIMLIQQQGIACGVSLDASTQLAQKDRIDFRDGFTEFEVGKVEKGAVDMIFGTGWWERGARADELPKDLKGAFYKKTDSTMTPEVIRYPNIPVADVSSKALGVTVDKSVLWPPRLQAVPKEQAPAIIGYLDAQPVRAIAGASVDSPPEPDPEPEPDPHDFEGVGGFA